MILVFRLHIYMLSRTFVLLVKGAWQGVPGLLVPKTFRSQEPLWGTFVPETFRFRELSFPGTKVPWNFRSRALSFSGSFVPGERKFLGTFVPWNFRSQDFPFPGTFVPPTILQGIAYERRH